MELLVVLVVLAVAGAVTVPVWSGHLDQMRLQGAARQLVAVLQEAQGQAILRGTEAQFVLIPESGHYWVRADADIEVEATSPSQVRRLQGVRVARVMWGRGLGTQEVWESAGSGESTDSTGDPIELALSFYPNGGADSVRIVLSSARDRRIAVTVDPLTARVHVSSASELTD